ncbi:hypothetical protein EV363DRAFT_1451437 [Boletus edulis]|nr:hypothetical protein EV363DRAFT_1451437 [Boletus edulis]
MSHLRFSSYLGELNHLRDGLRTVSSSLLTISNLFHFGSWTPSLSPTFTPFWAFPICTFHVLSLVLPTLVSRSLLARCKSVDSGSQAFFSMNTSQRTSNSDMILRSSEFSLGHTDSPETTSDVVAVLILCSVHFVLRSPEDYIPLSTSILLRNSLRNYRTFE